VREDEHCARDRHPGEDDEKKCEGRVLRHAPDIGAGNACFRAVTRMSGVDVLAIVLLACVVVLVGAAEWPRLSGRLGAERRTEKRRARRKQRFEVIDGEGGDDFAASVERDLANLPVIEERDDRSRR
jgi:hypothetical protein